MIGLWFIIIAQFAVIVWLVYDKLKKSPPSRGHGVSSEGD